MISAQSEGVGTRTRSHINRGIEYSRNQVYGNRIWNRIGLVVLPIFRPLCRADFQVHIQGLFLAVLKQFHIR